MEVISQQIEAQQMEEDYIRSSSSDNSSRKIVRYDIVSLDYYPEGGSLLIDFGGIDEEVLESSAIVLIGIKGNKLSSIEILFDNKDVINRLDSMLGGNMGRK